MKQLLKKIAQLETILITNKAIQLEKFSYYDSPANLAELESFMQSGKLQKSFIDFYRHSSGHEIKWSAKDEELRKNDITGSINILPFQQVFQNWEGVVFFEDTPADDPKRKFYPVDFFADEAAIGICTLPGYRETVHLYKFEGELIPLHIDMAGYLELQVYAKGFWYWQNSILEIIEGTANPASEKMQSYLPTLFPDFSWTAFENKYNELKTR